MRVGVGSGAMERRADGTLKRTGDFKLEGARLLFLFVAPFLLFPSVLFGDSKEIAIKDMDDPFEK